MLPKSVCCVLTKVILLFYMYMYALSPFFTSTVTRTWTLLKQLYLVQGSLTSQVVVLPSEIITKNFGLAVYSLSYLRHHLHRTYKGKGKDVNLYSASTCLQDSSNAHFVTETEPPSRANTALRSDPTTSHRQRQPASIAVNKLTAASETWTDSLQCDWWGR